MPSGAGLANPDVVVIGGGVAGSAAARLLASWGHLVVQVEREVARTPLAESIPPSCIPLLEVTGVRAAVDAAGFVRGGGNTVWWGGGPIRVEPFAGGRLGYQVLRERLEEVLGAAAESAGVIRLRPATARNVTPEGEAQRVDLTLPTGTLQVRAPWVLDCSGRAGVLARSERIAPPASERTLALVGAWERDGGWELPDPTHTLVESAEWGWGWSVPVSPNRRFFTAMLDPRATSLTGDNSVASRYDELLRSLPALGPLLQDARIAGAPWACEATTYGSREVATHGTLLVGDAASMIDPLSSFGVKKALASAWLAAVVVHTARVSPVHLDLALQFYRDREGAYVRSASRELGGVSRDADGAGAIPFWSARADRVLPGDDHGESDEPDVEALRQDPDVLAVFAQLRDRAAVRIEARDGTKRVQRPVVRGNVVVPEEHLVLRGFERGVRYLRSVDLLELLRIADRHDDVGRMYAEYARAHGAIPLPDFLGALSVVIAKGGARLLDIRPTHP